MDARATGVRGWTRRAPRASGTIRHRWIEDSGHIAAVVAGLNRAGARSRRYALLPRRPRRPPAGALWLVLRLKTGSPW